MADDPESGAPYIRSWLDLKMVTGRYSAGLVSELVHHVEHRSANVFAIFDEIGALEGAPNSRPTNTKPAGFLTGKFLSGLMHKHYSQAAFIPKNIQNHWRSTPFGDRAQAIMDDASIPIEKKVSRLADEFVIGAHRERSEAHKMTGEWIVYESQKDRNYYLTLGTHGEDEAIRARVLACRDEFPDLQFGI
jgi:hypothetical protein